MPEHCCGLALGLSLDHSVRVEQLWMSLVARLLHRFPCRSGCLRALQSGVRECATAQLGSPDSRCHAALLIQKGTEMDHCAECRVLIDTPSMDEPHARLQSDGGLELYAEFSITTYECTDCHTRFERRETMPRPRVTWKVIDAT